MGLRGSPKTGWKRRRRTGALAGGVALVLESRIPPGHLGTDQGPSRDVVLQAATCYDAADQAGTSRP